MNNLITRRNALIGAGVAVAVVGGGYEATRLFSKRHAPSPYDDLLAKIGDRDAGAQIGEAVLADFREFDAKTTAAGLRAKLSKNDLATVVQQDAAAGRLLEAKGWVLPETLGLLCALAAKTAA